MLFQFSPVIACYKVSLPFKISVYTIGILPKRLGTFPCYVVTVLLVLLMGFRTKAQSSPIKVGAALVEITPPAGYPHYRGELAGILTSSTGTTTPLYARALVFKQGNTKGALLVCDLNAIPRDIIRIVREQASEQTGIPFQHISITATHTHTAPALREAVPGYADREAAGTLTKEDKGSYLAQLIQRMTQSIITANQQAKESHLITGKGQVAGLSFNRRFLMTDGRVRFNPGPRNPKIVHPVGPTDPAVQFILFKLPDQNKFQASLTVFANHTDTEGSTNFSADYPFYLHKQLEEIFGKQLVSVFGIGPCGDINHIDVSQPAGAGKKLTEKIGSELAQAIKKALPAANQQDATLKIASRTLYLPLQNFTDTELQWAHHDTSQLYPERTFLSTMRRRKILSLEQMRRREAIPPSASGEPWLLPVEIHVFQLNTQTAIVTLPGEIFAELGLDLKKRSPFTNTMAIELANADIRYVPTRQAFAEGEYEAINSRLAPGSGEKMVEVALQLLHDITQAKN